MSRSVIKIDDEVNYPRGFTMTDNRIEDMLQRLLTPAEFVVWSQYLRFWGGDKKKAYPSLAYLSQATGLSEKTIRKSNRELSRKKFLTYISGGPGRSNLYNYVPVESIIKHYYGDENAKNIKTKKVEHNLNLTEKGSIFVSSFLPHFENKYLERYGYDYELDEKDSKKLSSQANELTSPEKFVNLVDIFFTTKNSYIDNSDRSIYFFFRPTVIKALVSEYNKTDKGRWEAQADKIWKELELPSKENWNNLDVEKWIRKNVHISGANNKRDEHVISILIKRVEKLVR